MAMGGLFDFGIASRLDMASNCGLWILENYIWIRYTQFLLTGLSNFVAHLLAHDNFAAVNISAIVPFVVYLLSVTPHNPFRLGYESDPSPRFSCPGAC